MLLLWIKIGIHNTQFRGGIWRIPNSKKTKKEIWKSTPTKWISDVFVHDNKFVIWLTWFYPFNLAIAEKEGKRLIPFFNETIRLHKPDWQHLTNRDLYQFNEHYSIVQMIARNAWTNTILEHKQLVSSHLATKQTRHQGTISPPTYSPPSEVFSPPTINKEISRGQ